VKHVSVLKYVQDVSVGMVRRFGALDSLVYAGIEYFAGGVDPLHAVARESIPELSADQHHTFAIFVVGGIFVSLERAIESIEDRNQIQDQALDSATPFFMTVALNPLPVIFEVGLTANKSLKELFLFLAELRNLQDER